MTVALIRSGLYAGLSTDTKPTTGVMGGDQFHETDTGKDFAYDGANWLDVTKGASIVGSLANPSDTITIGTGAAHAAGDVVSTDAGEILQFETGLTAGTGGVILASLVTLGQNAVFSGGAGYDLYLFDTSPAVQATNAPFDLADADVSKYVGKITIGTLVDLGSNCAKNDEGHNKPFKLATSDTKLYGKLVCLGGETTVTGKIITINLDVVSL